MITKIRKVGSKGPYMSPDTHSHLLADARYIIVSGEMVQGKGFVENSELRPIADILAAKPEELQSEKERLLVWIKAIDKELDRRVPPTKPVKKTTTEKSVEKHNKLKGKANDD